MPDSFRWRRPNGATESKTSNSSAAFRCVFFIVRDESVHLPYLPLLFLRAPWGKKRIVRGKRAKCSVTLSPSILFFFFFFFFFLLRKKEPASPSSSSFFFFFFFLFSLRPNEKSMEHTPADSIILLMLYRLFRWKEKEFSRADASFLRENFLVSVESFETRRKKLKFSANPVGSRADSVVSFQ